MDKEAFKYVSAMKTFSSLFLFSFVVLGCRPPPSEACQGTRVSWPFLEFVEEDDESDDPGVQIDLVLRTTLIEGTNALLQIEQEDGDDSIEASQERAVGSEGTLVFENVTLLEGEFILSIEAEVPCGSIRSERTAFLRTSQNDLRCTFSVEGESQSLGETSRVLDSEADGSDTEPGLQALLEVETGLNATSVELFYVNETTDAEVELEGNTEDGTGVSFEATFEDGIYNVRAICKNNESVVASPTLRYRVEL